MRVIILFFIAISLFSTGFAATKSIYGEGRFYAHDDDSLDFLKKQLLFSAFQDVITKELNNMELQSDLFWQRFDEKFEAYFTPIMDTLKKKYGLLEEESEEEGENKLEKYTEKELSKKIESYQKALRYKKLHLKSSFGRLKRAIRSYSTIKMSRSTQYANSKYIRISASVDRKILHQIYQEFTRNENAINYDTLYITASFGLQDMGWNDIGVDVEGNFTNVVKDHWKKWFEKEFSTYVEEVKITDSSMEKELSSYIKIPIATTSVSDLSETSFRVKNDLWLQLNVDIEKEDEDLLMQKRVFSFSGEYILMDLRSNTLLGHYDFIKETKKYDASDKHALSSNAASLVYRMPMISFEEVKRNFISLSTKKNQIVLEVEHIGNIKEIFEFNKLLQNKGITMQCHSEIRTISGSKATVKVTFQGSVERLMELLRSLHKTQVGNKMITFRSIEKPFVIDLVGTVTTVEDV